MIFLADHLSCASRKEACSIYRIENLEKFVKYIILVGLYTDMNKWLGITHQALNKLTANTVMK